jgi:hypothetical protein
MIFEYSGVDYLEWFKNLEKLAKAATTASRMWIAQSDRQNLNWRRSRATFLKFDNVFSEHKDFRTNGPMFVLSCPDVDLLIFLPDTVIRYPRRRAFEPTVWKFAELLFELKFVHSVESQTPPSDARRVGETWLYKKKDGSPDLRFSDNRIVPIFEYAQIQLFRSSDAVLVAWFYVSNTLEAEKIVHALTGLGVRKHTSATAGRQGRVSTPPPNPGRISHYAVLGITIDATSEDINQAYRELVKKYHPDRVTHLGEEFRLLAEQKMKAINEAYAALK